MGRSLGHLGEIDPSNWRDVPGWMLGPWWVGDFAPDVNISDYGDSSFHGRFHPAIPIVAMLRFTKPGDVVWDCFAGSGTTIDVGKELGRNVIATDLHSCRDDVIEMDVSVETLEDPVDLVIMHPPYMGIIDYDCPMSRAKTANEYRALFYQCALSVDTVLKQGHVLVLVIGEVWRDGVLIPLDCVLYDMMGNAFPKYRLLGRIVKDFGGYTTGGASGARRNTNLWKYRLLKNGYFRYGVDTIFFFQKT